MHNILQSATSMIILIFQTLYDTSSQQNTRDMYRQGQEKNKEVK